MKPLRRLLTLGLLASLTLLPAAVHADDNCLDAACEDSSHGIADELINAYPSPAVTQMLPNEQLLYDRVYRRVNGTTAILDAPGGQPVGTLDAGFNFVTVHAVEGDWTMINDSQWVPNAVLQDAAVSRFAGVRLPENPEESLQYPFAWVLVHTRASQTPGAEPLTTDPLYLRYQVVNIYDSVEVDGWRWYQVGIDQWIIQTQIAKFLPVERPAEIDTERWVSVDLYEQVMIAYEGNTPVYTSLVSSGMSDWPTNEGFFHVYVRYPRTLMSGAEGKPDFYFLEEVPWTMYFDGDIALHGAYWHDGFGYRRSHGCVNLSITDAAWLYSWASDEFDFSVDNDLGPAVYVYSSGDYR
ncbi:MAG: L,D-transpeptidase [Anaerolineae bacterium]|nr:L,D-transpeptidase [Anaerolineae bacterium]